jgi:hypothetical protein
MKLVTNPDCQIHDSKSLKTQCKTEFDSILKEVAVYRRENRLSDQDFRFFFSTLLAHYVGCLVEAEFEIKMAKWSDRLFSHWVQYWRRAWLTEQKSSSSPLVKKEDLEPKDEEIDLPAEIDAKGEVEAEFQRLVKSAPAPVRHMMLEMTRLQGAGPLPHPIFEKFTPQHIDKFLDYSHEDEVHAHDLASSNRWFHLTYIVLALAFLGFLIIYLAPSHKDLLIDILRLLIALAGGFGAGFGVKTWLERRK